MKGVLDSLNFEVNSGCCEDDFPLMAREPRFQYAGAVYHVMARGDGGKQLLLTRVDQGSFLHWLERVCGNHGWRVHVWELMGNHFHLLLETPEANLSSGMRVPLGTFSQAWNHHYQRRGHVFQFQGRYKSLAVAGERAGDALYFKTVADSLGSVSGVGPRSDTNLPSHVRQCATAGTDPRHRHRSFRSTSCGRGRMQELTELHRSWVWRTCPNMVTL